VTTVAVMQPYFFPYAGYFRLLARADTFVLYDDAQMRKGGRVHRTQVPGPSGAAEWLTLPIAAHPIATPIDACRFADGARERFAARVARHPWLRDATGPMASRIRDHLRAPLDSLVDYLEDGLRLVADGLGLRADIVRSSRMAVDPALRGQERVVALVRAAGGSRYVNAPGGRSLYDAETFARSDIELAFLPDYDGPFAMMLPAMMTEDPATVAADVLAR